jgi:RNA polymerase sigma-70 factor (ECF subfamily)
LLKKEILTEEELFSRFITGDDAAFRALAITYFPILCLYAQKILPDAALAEDIVQETFIKLWKHQGSFPNPAALKGFLFTLTRNGCFNLLRSRERAETKHRTAVAALSPETDPILADIVQAESIALIYNIVQTLPPDQQQVFFLSFEEGLTIAEIAARLNIPVAMASKQKYKALLVLRKKFRNKGLLFPLYLLA